MVALFNKAGAARGSKGFTLVELLVVIVVIGVLAAIAVPIFLSQSDKANDAALKSDLANAAKMLQVAEANGETLPSTMTAGQATDLGTAGTITPNVTLTVSGTGSTLCVEGTSDSGDVYSADMDNGLRNYDCDGNENGAASGNALTTVTGEFSAAFQVPSIPVFTDLGTFNTGPLFPSNWTGTASASWSESTPYLMLHYDYGSNYNYIFTDSIPKSYPWGDVPSGTGLYSHPSPGPVMTWLLSADPTQPGSTTLPIP